MPEVLFYVLSDSAEDDAVRFACRLAEKIYHQRRRIYLHVTNESAASQLDEALWTFRQGSFVPHAPAGELSEGNDPTPVAIGSGAAAPGGFDDVLINLADDVPGFFDQFQRAVEVVTRANRDAARRRYTVYRDHGCPLETHNIS